MPDADSSKDVPQTWREFAVWGVRNPGGVLTLIGVLFLISPGLIGAALERWFS